MDDPNPLEELERLLTEAENINAETNPSEFLVKIKLAELWVERIKAEAAERQAAALERIAAVLEQVTNNEMLSVATWEQV